MPVQKTDTGNAIRGHVQPTSRQMEDCHAVIGQITFDDLGRGPGTLHTQGDVRIDMQGRTGAGEANLQVQIGGKTAAAALVASTLLQTPDPANQRGAANAARSALEQSLDSATIWKAAGTLP